MDNVEVEDSMQWFRWWNDGVDDLKLLRLSYQHRWLWLVVLTMASKSPKRGYLYASEKMPCTEEDVVQATRLPPTTVQAGMRLLTSEQFSMLTTDEQGAWKVVNWEKRQPSKDDVAARVAKSRMKHPDSVTCNTLVTPPDNRVQNTDINTPPISPKGVAYPPEFEEFWDLYPRRINKKGALKAWRATANRDDPPGESDLARAALHYAEACRRDGTTLIYTMHPATFLGPQERWRDYLEPVAIVKDDFRPGVREFRAIDEFGDR